MTHDERPSLESLVREVLAWHSTPDSPDYCECEKSPCLWCANAKRALGDARPNHPVDASKMVETTKDEKNTQI